MAKVLESDMETPHEVKNGGEASSDMENPTSSDSESDDEAEDLQLEALERELVENPTNYDTHVRYIKFLRKLGRVEKLRQARESMNAIFPLSPTMWQEWTKDEALLNTGSEDFLEIEKLYEQGVQEYLSVSLWCDYINFVRERDPSVHELSPAGILKMRNLFERAITAAGLHVAEGSKIWEAYREFEHAIFQTIDKNNTEEKEKQTQRIRNILHRQLSIPLANSKSTLLSYKAWELEQGNIHEISSSDLDGIPSHVASSYQKATEMYNARAHFEEQISRQDVPDIERLALFMNYLKFEKSSGDPARVQILYERAVTEFPVSGDLWLDYTRFLDQTLKVPSVSKGVYSRATKNCTWIGELWVKYLLSLERAHASEEELSDVFERSLLCTFSSLEEYLDLFLTRVDGLRRRIPQAGQTEGNLDYAIIRDTFQHASDYLCTQLKNTDGLLHLHSYWARLELKLGKDLDAARGVWESLLKTSGSMLEAWKSYIAMEIELGNINEARSIYRRCYSKRFMGTGSEDICHSWLRFEREYGTLEHLDHAVQKVTPRLEELQLYRSQQESKVIAISKDQRESSLKKNAPEKRKMGTGLSDEYPPPKRHKDSDKKSQGISRKDKGHKSIEANSMQGSETGVVKPETNADQVKDSFSEKEKLYTDQCTAFVSNISLQANYEHLRDFFSDVGGVTAIRILKDKFTGKSRGLAYVDFCDDAHLTAAVKKNKQILLGKRVSIAKSDPKQRKRRDSSERGNAMERDGGAGLSGEQITMESDSRDPSSVSKNPIEPKASSSASHSHSDPVQIKGKNTFAVPRTVTALGWSSNKPKNDDEKPKSNDEFRKMLLKS